MRIERFAIDGGKELEAILGQLSTEVATKLGDKAVRASASFLRDEWKRGAPYLPGNRLKYYTRRDGTTVRGDYGHLRDNIRIRKVDARKSTAVVYRVTTGDAFWSYFLEFGTVNMAAHPWARPIVERLRSQLLNIQIDILRAGVETVTTGGLGSSKSAKFGRVLPNGRNS